MPVPRAGGDLRSTYAIAAISQLSRSALPFSPSLHCFPSRHARSLGPGLLAWQLYRWDHGRMDLQPAGENTAPGQHHVGDFLQSLDLALYQKHFHDLILTQVHMQ